MLKIIVIDSRKLSKKAVTWNQVALNQFSHPKVERAQEKCITFYDVLPFMQEFLCYLFAE